LNLQLHTFSYILAQKYTCIDSFSCVCLFLLYLFILMHKYSFIFSNIHFYWHLFIIISFCSKTIALEVNNIVLAVNNIVLAGTELYFTTYCIYISVHRFHYRLINLNSNSLINVFNDQFYCIYNCNVTLRSSLK
jgi:hypothetical protein